MAAIPPGKVTQRRLFPSKSGSFFPKPVLWRQLARGRIPHRWSENLLRLWSLPLEKTKATNHFFPRRPFLWWLVLLGGVLSLMGGFLLLAEGGSWWGGAVLPLAEPWPWASFCEAVFTGIQLDEQGLTLLHWSSHSYPWDQLILRPDPQRDDTALLYTMEERPFPLREQHFAPQDYPLLLHLIDEQACGSFEPPPDPSGMLGVVVASAPLPTGPFDCDHCGEQFKKDPFFRGEQVFCSAKCEQASRPLMPTVSVGKPLPAEEMITLLEESSRLAERAMQSASDVSQDTELLRLTLQGKGAGARVQQVVESLMVWGLKKAARLLQASPPPEPTEEGRYHGSPRFFQMAEQVKEDLLETDLGPDPFEVLQLQEPVNLITLDKQADRLSSSPEVQQTLENLRTTLREMEKGSRRKDKQTDEIQTIRSRS